MWHNGTLFYEGRVSLISHHLVLAGPRGVVEVGESQVEVLEY